MKTKWKTLSGAPVEDVVEWTREAGRNGQPVHVGTDSLQTGRHTSFVTVLAILNPPKGGRAAYVRVIVPRITSLRQRLLQEVWLSLEVAMSLAPAVQGDLTVHVDANPQERYMSSRYVQELTGMVVSNGFKVAIKPEAWCASHAADHVVRIHGKVPRVLGDGAQAALKAAGAR